MRLNKYIAQAGIASRRKADDLTINGQVKINGKTMREPGYDVMPDDVVSVAGKVITNREALVYYALNKPPGYITTTADEQDRPTVLSLLRDVSERIFPVGRLDAATTGLLILTNDG
ncbi:MAG TPA: S4 domain-containing protein, partial [Anaerovoracaceae bacterium]|nr:S4 domain-containing protein [Anaerovoracaceae bacterium]